MPFTVTVFRKLKLLFDLYEVHHLAIPLPRRKLTDGRNQMIGYLEKAYVKGGRIFLRGWCTAGPVVFTCGTARIEREPRIERQDVAASIGCGPNVGFEVSLPLVGATLTIDYGAEIPRQTLSLPLPGAFACRMARLRMAGRFGFDLLRGTPAILGGMRGGTETLKRQVKSSLRLEYMDSVLEIEPGALGLSPSKPASPPATTRETPEYGGVLTLVMPVYNAFEMIREALDRIARHTDVPWRLIVVEDASPDPEVRPWLRDWAAAEKPALCQGVELLENPENLGFIGSVNRAFARTLEMELQERQVGHVVLINSDAMVPEGWATRLIAPILKDRSVASVTPLSNNAEIFSAPVICAPVGLCEGQVDAMDAQAMRLSADAPPVLAPTGVGFCMAMNIDFLTRVPRFDTVFGPGYGEEVDWCQKTAELGGKHVAACNLFVEHRGGASFGSQKKQMLIEKNGRIITERYSGYDAEVQRFIARDPLCTQRLALALSWLDTEASSAETEGETPVFVAHALGGGAERYLQERIAQKEGNRAVVLRLGGTMRCRIEAVTPMGTTAAATDDLAVVRRLLSGLSRPRVIYSCAVGDPDPVAVPGLLVDLAGEHPLEILFHDFFPLSPAYTLLDSDMVFRGAPVPPRADPAHTARRPDGTEVSLEAWQAEWRKALQRAARIEVFSEDSLRLVTETYPETAGRVEVIPHASLAPIPRLPVPQDGKLVIGVLGNIGPQKGIRVLQALARRIRSLPDTELVVLGRVDINTPLPGSVKVHGAYALPDIPALAARYGISVWLIPSIWPETFSFATHECLATGLPVMSFDLGAQHEAVRAAPNGIAVALPEDGPWSETAVEAIL
ncbi:MAG: glycosyltransferase, partial [Roseovarius sp.]